MRPIHPCDHCLHLERAEPLGVISGPVKTSVLHVCCRCGERAYLAHVFGDDDQVAWEEPPAGHRFTPGEHGCAVCRSCARLLDPAGSPAPD